MIEQQEQAASEAQTRFSGTNILVVDDDELTTRSLSRVLTAQGCKVTCAHTVPDALRKIDDATDSFSAAVVDFFLFEHNAVEVISRLRAGSEPCCALMITGLGKRDAGREAIAAGADDFLLKPFELSDFLDAVERTVQRTETWRTRLSVEPDDQAAQGSPFSSETLNELRQVLLDGKPKDASGNRAGTGLDDRFLDLAACADILTEKGSLSVRERQILEHLLLGKRNHQIAEVAEISERTVKFHVTNILKKLGAESRGDLLRMLFERTA